MPADRKGGEEGKSECVCMSKRKEVKNINKERLNKTIALWRAYRGGSDKKEQCTIN